MSQQKQSVLYIIFVIGTLAYMLSGCATSYKGKHYEMKAREVTHPSFEPVQTSDNEKPMSKDELETLADLSFARGNLASALVQYDKAVEMAPNNSRLHFKKGRLFLAGELYQDAIQEFDAVIKIEPKNAKAYEQKGQAFHSMKEYDQAQKNFRRSLELDAQLWQAHNALGIIADYRGDYESAQYHYRKAIRTEPKLGLLYNNLGVSLSLAGEYDEAVKALRKAITNKCYEPKVYNNLGVVLCKIGKYGEALEAFAEIGGEARGYNNLGCVLLKEGEIEKAISCFKRAIALDHKFYQTASSNLKTANLARLKNVDKPWEYDSITEDTQVERSFRKNDYVSEGLPPELSSKDSSETGFLVNRSNGNRRKAFFDGTMYKRSYKFNGSSTQDEHSIKGEKEDRQNISESDTSPDRKFVINFGRNSKSLGLDTYQVLEEIRMLSERYKDCGITITGYTDSRGAHEQNLKLSKQRANLVKNYLVSRGIEPSKIMIYGKGSANSIADNETPEGRNLNRRVEIEINVQEEADARL